MSSLRSESHRPLGLSGWRTRRRPPRRRAAKISYEREAWFAAIEWPVEKPRHHILQQPLDEAAYATHEGGSGYSTLKDVHACISRGRRCRRSRSRHTSGFVADIVGADPARGGRTLGSEPPVWTGWLTWGPGAPGRLPQRTANQVQTVAVQAGVEGASLAVALFGAAEFWVAKQGARSLARFR